MTDLLVILAPPRSFTTVVSHMLGQHPQMYGLPETHLLTAETMAEWWNLCSEATFNMDHGVLRVVAELYFGGQTECAVKRASGWLRRRSHFTTGAFLELFAERVHPRVLVDKSPSIVYDIKYLQRVYQVFPRARFLHLVRHPRGQGESVMKYLRGRQKLGPVPSSHWLLHLASFPGPTTSDQPQPAPKLDPQNAWYALNMNICDFLKSVPDDQTMRIRGESLLADPDRGLREVAAWMGLRTDSEAIEEMEHPERSPYAGYGPRGALYGNDRLFLESPALRPGRMESHSLDGPLSWRKDGQGFVPEVRLLAQQFGYE
jgi:hypothetical protein